MKTPSYHFGYIYIILIRIFAVLTLLAALAAALFEWSSATERIRALRYVAPSSFIEKYNNLAALMRTNYEFVMMLNNQAPIPDAYVDAKRYLAPLGQTEWTPEDFAKFRTNLRQAGSANRALKDYLIADYCNTINTFIDEVAGKIEKARSQIVAPTPPPGQTAPALPSSTANAEKRRQYPAAPFLTSGSRDSDRLIREAEEALTRLESEMRTGGTAELKDTNVEPIARVKDYISMFRQLLGLSISEIIEEKRIDKIPESTASAASQQYLSEYQEYLNKRKRLDRVSTILASIRQVMIGNIKSAMTSEWSTDRQIPALLSEIDTEARTMAALEASKSEIKRLRWINCAKPLGTGLLIAFVLFVSADFLKALLDTARHTGFVAEHYRRDSNTSSDV